MKIKIKKHKKTSRKGENGKVLIIGGSEDYAGALALAGLAALRTGCDWVTIAAPEKVAWAINGLTPDLVTKKVKGNYFAPKHVKMIAGLAKGFDAVLIGNGIGRSKETFAFVRKVVKLIKKPLVIDADAIKALKIKDVKNSVFTPHQGEFEILLKNSGIKLGDSIQDIKKLQNHLGTSIILLKGHTDYIISKSKIAINRTGNERMTVAGTGDVLAGLVAGFASQRYNLFEAARYSAYINGTLGDILKRKKGYSYIASDLVEDFRKIRMRGIAMVRKK
jgi:hydroxyethylthiazole kinase-like uncharacterized protein yjeF